jgi:hypothetical protein
MSATVTSEILDIIRSEYEELPKLRLTVPQASRLWSLDTFNAQALLDGLVRNGFLMRTPDGCYGRLSAC